ncbi:helix-turn-helix transcriptional regulator [Microbacterium shaanxiense]
MDALPVAPHVAALIRDFARGDRVAALEVARALTADQRTGEARLPDALPAVPAVQTATAIDRWNTATRRLLLIAALAVTDRVDVHLLAASVDTDVFLSGDAADALEVRSGRILFRDERVRSVILHDASPKETVDAHAALARAARSLEERGPAIWHAALAAREIPARAGQALLSVAGQRIALGDFEAAQRIGRLVEQSSTSQIRTRAREVAGAAALWSGHLGDALQLLQPAANRPSSLFLTAQKLRDGRHVMPGEDPRHVIAEGLPQLQRHAANARERTMLGFVIDVFRAWFVDPAEADRLMASVLLSAPPTHTGYRWATGSGSSSPLLSAHVVLMQMSAQLQFGVWEEAAATLHAGMRLPLAYAGSGAISSFVRILARQGAVDRRLEADFDAIGPELVVRYDMTGPPVGHRSVAVGRQIRAQPLNPPDTLTWSSSLTARETEVAGLIARGLNNRTIAATLSISERTVEVHASAVLRKAGVASRSGFIAALLRRASPTPSSEGASRLG